MKVLAKMKSFFAPRLSKLKPLVAMQLKDKLDFSFFRSKRDAIIKIVVEIIKFVAVTAVFYALFLVCKLLAVFRPAGVIPDTVVNVIFVIIQLLSLITCTAGLVEALYMTADNKVLLTLPTSATVTYSSKLVVYFFFELKKNFTFTLPMFLAYGIISNAVWYYYPWILFCFVLVSMLPVALGAVLSIPALWVMTFTKNHRLLQFLLITLSAAAVTFGVVTIINKIPENIDIIAQWGTISQRITDFLSNFSNFFKPYYLLTQMMVGNTARISSKLFGFDTLYITASFIGVLIAVFALSFLIAKPLFIKTASKQFEYEKAVVPAKKNKLHAKRLAPYAESLLMNFRSTRNLIDAIIEIVLPGVAILLLNRVYAAMNTDYVGKIMIEAFNFLVMLILLLAFNNQYATVYSKEAGARNLLKTRPIDSVHVLLGRISLRIITTVLSAVGVVIAYLVVSDVSDTEIVLTCLTTAFVSLAHLLWCAESDVMHSYADQYATVGIQFDSPNERNATILGFVLSALFAFLYYFFSVGKGAMHSLTVLLIASVLFLAFKIFTFLTRAKLYFAEN